MTAAVFDRLCASLARFFNVMSLGAVGEAIRTQGRLPDRAVVLTFDDGFADNAEIAAPILARHGLTASVFVTTGYLDGGIMFNDAVVEALRTARRDTLDLAALGIDLEGKRSLNRLEERVQLKGELLRAFKYRSVEERLRLAATLGELLNADPAPSLMMRPAQVKQMADEGFEIGGHTVTHPILATLPPGDAAQEIREGREQLEAIIQRPVVSFAYPNGRPNQDYDLHHVSALEVAGFKQAVTTAYGTARSDDDLLQLPRLTCWDRRALTFVPRMLGHYWRGRRGRQLPRASAAA